MSGAARAQQQRRRLRCLRLAACLTATRMLLSPHLAPPAAAPHRSVPATTTAGYPPTLYADMVRDEKTSKKIEANRKTLKAMGTPVEVVDVSARARACRGGGGEGGPHALLMLSFPISPLLQVTARKVYPTYFSERFPSEVSEGARLGPCQLGAAAGWRSASAASCRTAARCASQPSLPAAGASSVPARAAAQPAAPPQS